MPIVAVETTTSELLLFVEESTTLLPPESSSTLSSPVATAALTVLSRLNFDLFKVSASVAASEEVSSCVSGCVVVCVTVSYSSGRFSDTGEAVICGKNEVAKSTAAKVSTKSTTEQAILALPLYKRRSKSTLVIFSFNFVNTCLLFSFIFHTPTLKLYYKQALIAIAIKNKTHPFGMCPVNCFEYSLYGKDI